MLVMNVEKKTLIEIKFR